MHLAYLLAAHAFPYSSSLSFKLYRYLQRNAQDSAPGANTLPAVPFTLTALVDFLKAGYRYFHKGKFDDARKSFDSIVHSIPLVVVDTRSEEMEVKQLLDICREYITALRLQSARKEGKTGGEEPKRLAELAAYFTNCKLQPAHLALALDVAMSSACVLCSFLLPSFRLSVFPSPACRPYLSVSCHASISLFLFRLHSTSSTSPSPSPPPPEQLPAAELHYRCRLRAPLD